jgi:flagellar biosynthesis GTPase FlhF
MRVKSFFCESVEEALSMAQNEMGPEALLLNSREAPPEGRHLGKFEVVFGLQSGKGASHEAPAVMPPEAGGDRSLAKLSREIAELRKEMEQIRGPRTSGVPAAAPR